MKYAHERIVYLPPDLAIVYALEQNFRLDLQRGNVSVQRWEFEKHAYLREAVDLVLEQGFNYYPGSNDEPWLHVKHLGERKIKTAHSDALIDLFNLYYDRAVICGKVGFEIPDPAKINTPTLIRRYVTDISKRFETH